MVDLHKNRWHASEQDFAQRIEVADVPGFFSKSLTIEPGTRALFLEKGQLLGEVPPNEYTLQTLTDRLKIWTKKKTTVVLAREQEVFLDLQFSGLPSREFLEVEAEIRISVGIEDVALFFKNLMSSRQKISMDELKEIVEPIVRQAIYETTGRLSLKDLKGADARENLELTIRRALSSNLALHGLKFGHVQTLSVSHPQFDSQQHRIGEIWLQRQGLELDKDAAKLEEEKLFAEIQKRESLDELNILGQQVDVDRMEGELAVKLRRLDVRKNWRSAVRADEFDQINSQEELRRFLQVRDKERLISDDEYETLVKTVQERAEDRDGQREHLLKRIAIEQEFEIESLRADLDHAEKSKALHHEFSLAAMMDKESQRKWTEQLNREEENAVRRRDDRLKEIEHTRMSLSIEKEGDRDEQLKDVLHEQQVRTIRREIELADAEHSQRAQLIAWETERSIEEQRIETERRKAELRNEQQAMIWESQKDKLAFLQKMNEDFLTSEQDRRERSKRLDAELRRDDETRQRTHELEELRIRAEMSAEALVATSNVENAALLANMKQHEATENTKARVGEAQAAADGIASAEVKELHRAMTDQERQKSDAIIKAMQEAMASQQAQFANSNETIKEITKNLGHSGQQPIIVTGQGVSVPNSMTQPASDAENKVFVCASCRAENPVSNRACGNCGKSL